MARKYTKKCPDCGSIDIAPIIYGMPGHKMQKDYTEGKIKLGGCSIILGEKQADRYCKACEFKWNKDDRFCKRCGDVELFCKCYEDSVDNAQLKKGDLWN